MIFTEKNHLIKGLDPVADAFAGTVTSDIVNLEGAEHVTFVIYKAVGDTGTSTITVEACDDTSPTNVSAVTFHYRAYTTGDTAGTLTAATTTGFVTTAGSSQMYAVECDAAALAASGYAYIRLKAVESVNSPVLGGILIITSGLRYAQNVPHSAIV